MREIVLYHANCNDGLCAAWLWRRSFPKVSLKAVQYGSTFPWKVLDNHESVTILDFSYTRSVLEKVALACGSSGGRLLVLDHHKTAAEDLKGFPHAVFDMEKSGARLTHDWLQENGREPGGKWLVDYTEDRDLWRWKLPGSRAVSAAINSFPRTVETWDHIYKVYETAAYIIPEGRAILRYQERVIESMVRPGKVAIVRIGGYAVPCINITDPFLISEVVGQLAEKYPKHMFAAGYFITANGEVCYSLRSRHGCDVSIVAGKLGGGGHPRAAGFRIDHVIRAI